MTRSAVLVLTALWPLRPAWAGVELRVEPGREQLRPFETAAIEVRFTGADRPLGASLPPGGAIRIRDKDGGWLSKPFRYPATDETARTLAVLYTAPAKSGRYSIEARFKFLNLEVEIGVTPSAPSHRAPEAVSFGPESEPRDFYRDLAEHFAPLVAQETWFEPRADFLARFDYDGDWRGDNNWDNLATGSSQAYVYYAAMETATHYFLVYNFFHPRRYSDACPGGACYENDNGGIILTVRKDGSRYGRPQVMETVAQNNAYFYTSDSRIRDGVHRISGPLALWRDSHPIVFIESGSHGVYGAADSEHARFSIEHLDFAASTGVIYRFGGAAGRPRHPNDREVSYELLSAGEQWWPRAISHQGLEGRTFDEFFHYAPLGSRPRAVVEEMAGAFLGRKYAANQARPFWGWFDGLAVNRRLLAKGQCGLDPAYALWVSLKVPTGAPFSLAYTYNPYLEAAGRSDTVTALPTVRSSEPGPAGSAAAPGPPAGSAAAQRLPAAAPKAQRQVLSPPAEKPNYKLKDRHGQLEFRARVDGTVYLLIHGDQIEVEYLSGRPMDEIRYRFSQPLPSEEMEEVKLEDIEGRGSVRLLEWPNAGNQFTAKIRLQDEKPGAASYKFRLAWKR